MWSITRRNNNEKVCIILLIILFFIECNEGYEKDKLWVIIDFILHLPT